MKNSIIIKQTNAQGEQTKEIYEISEDEINNYLTLGKAVGQSFEHCFYLGAKHKENFWHRVYGYQFIKDEKIEKLLEEEIKKATGQIQHYISVCFYEKLTEERHAFIPRRLNIDDRPELNNFPFNVLFGTSCIADDGVNLQTAEYLPDFSSYQENNDEQRMKYFNRLDADRRFWLEIIYSKKDKSYQGNRYYQNELISITDGKNWDGFFVHLTMSGIAENPE